VEKPRSPAVRPIPEWCLEYQRRIEDARREYLLIKEQAEPEEALEGQGEIDMLEPNTNLVQDQLSELAQQIVHVLEACNLEKDVLKEEFDSVRNGIVIMESRLQTEKIRLDAEVSGVGSMARFQEAMLQELRARVQVLQTQDNQIVQEATELFGGMRSELEAQSKRITGNALQLIAVKASVQAVQKGMAQLSKRVDEVVRTTAAITTSLKQIPTKLELRQHAQAMEEHKVQMTEVNTGLTTAMEEYKFSQSTPYNFRRPSVVAGPSGTQRRSDFDRSPMESSLRDTGSEYSWHAQLRGGAGSNMGGGDEPVAGGEPAGAAGGEPAGGAAEDPARGADEDPAGGANGGAGGGDPPPPPPPESGDEGNGGRRPSRRQRRIKELEFAKPIKIKEPKKFFGKPGEDFDTWWVLVQVYIEDQPEKFPKDQRTIDWIGSLMESYAASWHIQWLKGTLNGTHPKSMTGYVSALKLRFEDKDAKDEAYAELEEVRYEGCIRDMFTRIQTLNDKAMVSGAALKKSILERLPQKILEQMHVVDLTGKTDNEIITIITNAGRTAEKWEAARKNLGLKASFRKFKSKSSKYDYGKEETEKPERRRDKRDRSQRSKRGDKKDRSSGKFKQYQPKHDSDNKTEGIDSSELSRRRAAGECLRCAWPSDRKGTHRVKDCVRPIKLDKGTATFPKAKEYQKMKVAAVQLSDSTDTDSSETSESSDSSESEEEPENSDDLEEDYLDDSTRSLEQEEQEEGNWWDSPDESS